MSYSTSYDHLADVLNRLPFVTWDRYLEWEDDETGDVWAVFYGWIERDDEYKDFASIKINASENEIVDFLTSSSEHSEEIHERLGFDLETHNQCHRVENLGLDVNAVNIDEN